MPGESSAVDDIDPYRTDRPTLVAENARLRRELAHTKRRRAWPAVASLGVYVLLVTQLRDWLNGTDATRYWLAIISLVASLGVSVAVAIRLLFTPRD